MNIPPHVGGFSLTTGLTTMLFSFLRCFALFFFRLRQQKSPEPFTVQSFSESKWWDSNPRPFGPEPCVRTMSKPYGAKVSRGTIRFDYRFDYQTPLFRHFGGYFPLLFGAVR